MLALMKPEVFANVVNTVLRVEYVNWTYNTEKNL